MARVGYASHSKHPQRRGACMNDYTRKLFDKAMDTIEGAELLLEHGKIDMAAGRAYYALFYIAEAPLNEKGLQFSAPRRCHWRIRKRVFQNEVA
jgi:uncharacterized protein (UPF0332 family)